MSFEEHCVHCEHYHDGGQCCYCKKSPTDLKKSPEQHREELAEILEDEIDT